MGDVMRVRFLQDYQGQWTGPHFYRCDQEYDLDNAVGALLVGDGRAVEVAPPVQPAQTAEAVLVVKRSHPDTPDDMTTVAVVPLGKRGRKGASGGGIL